MITNRRFQRAIGSLVMALMVSVVYAGPRMATGVRFRAISAEVDLAAALSPTGNADGDCGRDHRDRIAVWHPEAR